MIGEAVAALLAEFVKQHGAKVKPDLALIHLQAVSSDIENEDILDRAVRVYALYDEAALLNSFYELLDYADEGSVLDDVQEGNEAWAAAWTIALADHRENWHNPLAYTDAEVREYLTTGHASLTLPML